MNEGLPIAVAHSKAAVLLPASSRRV